MRSRSRFNDEIALQWSLNSSPTFQTGYWAQAGQKLSNDKWIKKPDNLGTGGDFL